jgi:hypothetical protein
MDAKQIAEKLRTLTREQAKEIIGLLEGWGWQDVSVAYDTVEYGKSRFTETFPAVGTIRLIVQAKFDTGEVLPGQRFDLLGSSGERQRRAEEEIKDRGNRV